MKDLQIDVLYSEDVGVWDGVRMPMQEIQNTKWTEINLMDQEDPEASKNNLYGLVEYLMPITKMLIWNRRLIK